MKLASQQGVLLTGGLVFSLGACEPALPSTATVAHQPTGTAATPTATGTTAPMSAAASTPVPTAAWRGRWVRRDSRFSPADLALSVGPSPGTATFSLAASSGTHIGSIDGVASLGSSEASYQAAGCALRLVQKNGGIEVRSIGCEQALGAGVVLDGQFWPATTPSAHATSFDCRSASSAVLKVICQDDLLASADVAMAEAYRAGHAAAMGPLGMPNLAAADAFAKQQQDWLSVRDRCSTAAVPRACLVASYRKRILALRRAAPSDAVDRAALRRALAQMDGEGFWEEVTLQLYLADRLGANNEALQDKMMMVSALDDAGAAAVEGCVRGICPDSRGYVALDDSGGVWAALYPGGDTGNEVLLAPATGAEPASLKAWLAALGPVQVTRLPAPKL